MIALIVGTIFIADPPKPTPAWTPKDREMVVLVGSAFIEQEARDGYLETELIRLFPNKDIRVRNLGWSGDTVHCQARAYFGPPQEGFDRLRGHLAVIKPTTVICCYGANESWKGDEGIGEFRKGYERLIDMIREATGATVVLMTPPRFEPRGSDYMRLARVDDKMVRYSQEIKYIAEARRCVVNDLANRLEPYGNMTNGVHFSAYFTASEHFWNIASPVQSPTAAPFNIVQDFDKSKFRPINTELSEITKTENKLRWTQIDALLPSVWLPVNVVTFGSRDRIAKCLVDGNEVQTHLGTQGVIEILGPERKQLEALRLAIVKKNALFFHRWRPANETYLYGFRKHEQGNNGVEPPMFDKLVEQAEAEIAVLKKPVPHKYELVRVEEK